MKARIEKKLSKKLVELLPKEYRNAWKCHDEPSDLAYEQGTSVSGVMYIGGGLDYYGEAEDAYTVWEDFTMKYLWMLGFPEQENCGTDVWRPDCGNFKLTGKSAIQKIRRDGIK